MRSTNWRLYSAICLALLVMLLAACGTNNGNEEGSGNGNAANAGNEASGNTGGSNSGNAAQGAGGEDQQQDLPIVTIEMDSGKTIKLELYPEIAPESVHNFISLIEQGFYDGTIFHRVIPGFMIQGGDPDGTGMGGPGYGIKGEFEMNGFQNDLKHTRGVLSMARSQHPDSAGSQFFIMVQDSPHLDGQYAAFGKVIEGIETADEIVALDRDAMDRPLEVPVMKKVTVDTKGKDYPEPTKVK